MIRLSNTVKVSLTSLSPDTVYRVRVAAATESIVSRGEFFIGPYSSVHETKTLGESLLLLHSGFYFQACHADVQCI